MDPFIFFPLRFQSYFPKVFPLLNEPFSRLVSNQFNHLHSNKLENYAWINYQTVPGTDDPCFGQLQKRSYKLKRLLSRVGWYIERRALHPFWVSSPCSVPAHLLIFECLAASADFTRHHQGILKWPAALDILH